MEGNASSASEAASFAEQAASRIEWRQRLQATWQEVGGPGDLFELIARLRGPEDEAA